MSNGTLFPKSYEDDRVYEDSRVSILNPASNRGVLVRTNVRGVSKSKLKRDGLKSGKRLAEEGKGGKRKQHPYVFFRAPYYSMLDQSSEPYSCDAECSIAAYGDREVNGRHTYIRVDPVRTMVYSSEIRALGEWNGSGSYDAEMVAVDRSEKPMSEYFRILKANNEARLPKPWNPDEMMIYSSRYSWNMVTSKLRIDINTKESPMHTLYDIARTSEVLVELECIPPEWLVDVEI
jgi:hypothetical protein